MAGVLSLNGKFTYPVELLKTLTADENSTFKKSVSIGSNTVDETTPMLSVGESNESTGKNSASIGRNCISRGESSVAIGNSVSTGSDATAAFALGTLASASNKNSFVWSGNENTSTIYNSRGDGTFCIKPKNPNGSTENPENGFFIGETAIPEIIKNYAIEYVSKNNTSFTGSNSFENETVFNGGISINVGSVKTASVVETVFEGAVHVPETSVNDTSDLAASTQFVADNIKKCVKLNGDTMTGDLILNREPEYELQAATKGYVDDAILDAFDSNIDVNNEPMPSGIEIARIMVNKYTTPIYSPKIVGGQNINVKEDISNGQITVSYSSDEKFAGGSIKVPVGTIVPFCGSNTPYGFIFCDGGEYSRTEYSELYSVIGTRYGSGNGSSTFNIPNLNNGKIIRGSSINAPSYEETQLKSSDEAGYGIKTVDMRYYIKAATVKTDLPVTSVNGVSPDDNGNVDVVFTQEYETWTFKTMSGEEYTRNVVIKK